MNKKIKILNSIILFMIILFAKTMVNAAIPYISIEDTNITANNVNTNYYGYRYSNAASHARDTWAFYYSAIPLSTIDSEKYNHNGVNDASYNFYLQSGFRGKMNYQLSSLGKTIIMSKGRLRKDPSLFCVNFEASFRPMMLKDGYTVVSENGSDYVAQFKYQYRLAIIVNSEEAKVYDSYSNGQAHLCATYKKDTEAYRKNAGLVYLFSHGRVGGTLKTIAMSDSKEERPVWFYVDSWKKSFNSSYLNGILKVNGPNVVITTRDGVKHTAPDDRQVYDFENYLKTRIDPTLTGNNAKLTVSDNKYQIGPINTKYTYSVSYNEYKTGEIFSAIDNIFLTVVKDGEEVTLPYLGKVTQDGKSEWKTTGNFEIVANNGKDSFGSPKSGDFYIKIPTTGIETIKKLKITYKRMDVEGEFYYMKALNEAYGHNGTTLVASGSSASGQDLIGIKYARRYYTQIDREIEFDFTGNLKIIKVDQDVESTKLEGVKFKINKTGTDNWVKAASGIVNYTTEDDATVFTTNYSGEVVINGLEAVNYTIYEQTNPNYGYTVLDTATVDIVGGTTVTKIVTNSKQTGNLQITKVDRSETDVKLPDVEFILQSTSGSNSGKYLILYGTNGSKISQVINSVIVGDIVYTTDKSEATILKTNDSGEVVVKNILAGSYKLIEIKNPNYGYTVTDSDAVDITLSRQSSVDTALSGTNISDNNKYIVTNERRYTRIEGLVWLDQREGKGYERDDLYTDSIDKTIGGVWVTLRDVTQDNKIIQEVTVGDDGKYSFENVEIDKLQDYFVEFQYDGQLYQSVKPHIDKANGSKVDEWQREIFNSAYKEITNIDGNDQTNKGYGRNDAGEIKKNLEYVKTEHTSTYKYNADYIQANTNAGNYYLKDQTIDTENPVIKDVNLGIFEREKADLALINDINDVKLTINGYENTYIYNQRATGSDDLTTDENGDDGTGFNVGVKFGLGEDAYGNRQYTQPVYRPDIRTVIENKENKLQVYITYVTTIRNQSQELNTKITEIVNYIDNRCTIVDSYTKNGDKLTWQTTSKYNNDTYAQDGYVGHYTTSLEGTTIRYGQKLIIYTTLKLSDETVSGLFDNKTTLDNVVEINSYETYDKDGAVYGAIDKDSAPGNAIPTDRSTFEDDTDSAPSLLLDGTKTREITGNIFEDNPVSINKGQINTNEERLGDGIYSKDTENVVSGVKVELYSEDKGEAIETITTNNSGEYTLGTGDDIVPGKYVIRYTYTDGTTAIYDLNGNKVDEVTVESYKSTIQDDTLNYSDPSWYKDEYITSERYSDAKDDYSQRYDGSPDKTSMTASTTTMDIGIEIITSGGTSTNNTYVDYQDLNKLVNQIENIDFGIILKPRQQVVLTKEIENVKITLQNGAVLIDGKPSEVENYAKYAPPQLNAQDSDIYTRKNNLISKGVLNIEIDDEIIHGSTIEIKYKMTVVNVGELDYDTERYYYYGKDKTNKVVTKVGKVIDYVDNSIEFIALDQDSASNWQIATSADVGSTIQNSYETIITSDALSSDLAPGEKKDNLTLKVRKLLTTTSGDLTFENMSEIVSITTTNNRKQETSIPGNYNPTNGENEEIDTGISEIITITPPTGENRDYIVYGLVGMVTLVIFGTGVVLIKKKAL